LPSYDPNQFKDSQNSLTIFNFISPGQYDITGKFLSGTNPRKSAFPKATPFRDKGFLGPGPGAYQPIQSLGKQVLSTKHGNAPISFPKANRPNLIPPGTTEIGPAEYKPPAAACDKQFDSRKSTCPKVKFGEGYIQDHIKQNFDFREPAPGPGSYRLPGGVATKGKGTPFRNAPTAILSSRQKFGSPFKEF
jgi:hypothetical protein